MYLIPHLSTPDKVVPQLNEKLSHLPKDTVGFTTAYFNIENLLLNLIACG